MQRLRFASRWRRMYANVLCGLCCQAPRESAREKRNTTRRARTKAATPATNRRRARHSHARRRSPGNDDATLEAAGQMKPLVLIIEDSQTCASHLAARLRAHPHHATVRTESTITGARRWLDEVRPRKPDLVVLDVALPDGNGLDLLPLLHDSQVVVVSATPQSVATTSTLSAVPKGPTWATQIEAILTRAHLRK